MTVSIKNFFYKLKDGCWHTNMSQPITIQGQTYRICIDCTKYRLFDTERWEMYGGYFSDVTGDKVAIHRRSRF